MECPACYQPIPIGNVAVAIDEAQEPYVRCHVCQLLLRVMLVEADDDEDPDIDVRDHELRLGPPKV